MSLKRKIDLIKINAITISRIGTEFVLHVQDEYDYRYSTIEYRDIIIDLIRNNCLSEILVFSKDIYTLD